MQNFTKSISLLLFLCLFSGIKLMAQNSDGVSEQLADSIARFKKDSVNIANGA